MGHHAPAGQGQRQKNRRKIRRFLIVKNSNALFQNAFALTLKGVLIAQWLHRLTCREICFHNGQVVPIVWRHIPITFSGLHLELFHTPCISNALIILVGNFSCNRLWINLVDQPIINRNFASLRVVLNIVCGGIKKLSWPDEDPISHKYVSAITDTGANAIIAPAVSDIQFFIYFS